MTTGHLPFEDDVMQRTLQKIAYTEPQYPVYLSVQLIHLLRKILTKDPESRLTIDKIKQDPWFSQGEYTQLFQRPLSQDESFSNRAVEREIVDRIAALGVDTKMLPGMLLAGECNETTALYAMLRREEVTDRLKGLMSSLSSTATANKTLAIAGIPRPRQTGLPFPRPTSARANDAGLPPRTPKIPLPLAAKPKIPSETGVSRPAKESLRLPSMIPRRERSNSLK
jgi:serine/threonine protein kinase